MKKYVLCFIVLFLLSISQGYALNRDYKSDCDENKHHQEYYHSYCLKIEEDFKKVVWILEEQNIMNQSFRHGQPKYFPKENPKIIRSDHKKFINDVEVYTVFETYLELGETYLKDAWVITQ